VAISKEKQTEQIDTSVAYSQEAITEQRYLWMARVFATVAVVSFCANVMLVMALFSLLPIVRVQPFYLYTQDKDEQIITVSQPPQNELRSEVLQESFIRQYLLAYFTIGSDIQELERRWGLGGSIEWMSTPSVFQEFVANAGAWLEDAKREGMTRNVRILFVSKFREDPQGGDIWRAEVELTDMTVDNPQPRTQKLMITMQVGFRVSRPGLLWKDRLKNPLGFTVTRFGIQPAQ
jgi:type IV secretory pathway component VirB8